MKTIIFHQSGDFCKLTGYYYCMSNPNSGLLMEKGDMFPYVKQGEYQNVLWVYDHSA